MKVTWETEDGYCGKSRPHTLAIDDDSFEDDMTEEDRRKVIDEAVQEDFEQKISWVIISVED